MKLSQNPMKEFIKNILRKCPCYRVPRFKIELDDIERDLRLR